MKWAVITLFRRVMNNNVKLYSNWLFHMRLISVTHTAGRKHRENIFQYFLLQLYHWVIYTVNKIV